MSNTNNDIDLNEDGKVNEREIEIYEQRAKSRRGMAWLALIAMIVSAFCFMFVVPESRLKTLDGLLEIYWIGLSSIVGAYVGISTWMSRK